MRVADYLVKSLNMLGITDFFGLPGDYNFNILYAINSNPNTNWIGCTNELNAGYAADGYAREKGFGAIVTTYGVGELSAINAIAGSYAENVPVINIVGVPASKDIKNKKLIHHNFQNPDYYAFERTFSNVVETTAYLDKENAKTVIDRVISVFVKERRPVYIAVPIDVALEETNAEPEITAPMNDKETLNIVLEKITNFVQSSKYPVFLADNGLKRFDNENKFVELLKKTGYPVTNFVMGIGTVNTSFENYLGTYLADFGNNAAGEMIKNTDCLISFGAICSDLNTFGFSLPYDVEDYIAVYGTYTVINHERYNNVLMTDVINGLIDKLPRRNVSHPEIDTGYKKSVIKNEELSSEYIYPRLQEFFEENDCIIIETGIIPYGFASIKLPNNVTVHTQTLWGSIGWATPAAFGAGIALKDNKRRVILFTGEGSHQLTACEISNMMHHNLNPIVILLNNNGYTIERILSNSPDDNFNDIIRWDYSKLPKVFSGDVKIFQARTDKEFNAALAEARRCSTMCYIEIFTSKEDIPLITQKTIDKLKAVKC